MIGVSTIGRTEVKGLVVSTIESITDGYQTAILDANRANLVERYDGLVDAEEGHKKWCEKAKTITHVTFLGNPDWGVDDKKVELKRINE